MLPAPPWRLVLVGTLLTSVVFGLQGNVSTASPQKSADADGLRAPQALILFVGSSIVHRWTHLAEQMAPLTVVNRGIDGLQTTDLLRMIDRGVLPLRPRVVVYYCGSNDIDVGEPTADIVQRIRQFVERVTTELPATRVVFLSINRAPEKRDRWDVVDDVNRQIARDAAASARLQYVDVNPVLFTDDGVPRIDLYMPDELHLRPAAYEGFATILKPVLGNILSSQPAR